ncbi:MAG: hypothetical protein R3E01_15975 [Pirellulaceae bacterium]|nr:hypothetical protein [Planctomycetales bacterium]
MNKACLAVAFSLLFFTSSAVLAQAPAFGSGAFAYSSPYPTAAADNFDADYISYRPTVSPYLRMAGDLGNAANPFGLPAYHAWVKPEIERRTLVERQQQSLSYLQRQVTDIETTVRRQTAGGIGTTGHSSRFMSYSHYYPQLQRQ